MTDRFVVCRNLKTLLTILWMAFLCCGLAALFVVARFKWPLLTINENFGAYIGYPAVASGLCALVMAVVYLVRMSRKMVLPALIFLLDCALVFSPLQDMSDRKDFADFTKPESAYVQKHCVPMNFVQDGRTYGFGMCDLVMDGSGQMEDFSFVYDTSNDIVNYNYLSKNNKITFVSAIRRYFKDNPNEQFESAYFTETRYYRSFFG